MNATDGLMVGEPNHRSDRAITKDDWRTRLLAARRAVTPELRTQEAAAISAAARSLAVAGRTVCCYVPVGAEPGSPAMLDELVSAGARVLLPVVTGASPLDWAEYDGALQAGPHRLLEPAGPRLGAAAIAEATLILVPALAVDRSGVRLGRGAGHYDRSLVLAPAGTELIGVIRDEEFLGHLPSDPHDVMMSAVLTPARGVLELADH